MLGRLQRHLYDRRVRQIHQGHRARHAEDYARIDAILKEFRTAGGLKHDYQAYKLFSLWQLLLAERPQRLLEFGSGTSTALFADYIRGFDGELWSVDESPEWLANSRRLAAIEDGDRRFVLRHAEKRITRRNDVPTEIGYDIDLGDQTFDLVLVDGPSLRVDGQRFKQAINPDVFRLIEHTPPPMILVDIRAATVDAIAERVPELYQCARSDVILKAVRPDYRYFTEFRLKADSTNR